MRISWRDISQDLGRLFNKYLFDIGIRILIVSW